MQQIYGDLTISDVLTDPLILAVNQADGITHPEFKTLLYNAADAIGRKSASKSAPHFVSAATFAGTKRKLQMISHPLSALHDNNCASAACY